MTTKKFKDIKLKNEYERWEQEEVDYSKALHMFLEDKVKENDQKKKIYIYIYIYIYIFESTDMKLFLD